MEGGLAKGSFLVYGLRDGSASLYLSTGGGTIGGGGRPMIRAAAKRFVQSAREVAPSLPLVREHPLPSMGRVRFSVFTPEGVRAAEAVEADLEAGRGELLPLFVSAHELIARFRHLEQPKPPQESEYLNCLLMALARGKAASVTLTKGVRLPDPAALTEDALDVEYIAEQEFDYTQLSANHVVAMVRKLAGFRWFHFGRNERRFRTRLVAHGGKSDIVVTFRVERRKRHGGMEVQISRLTP
jgi:hypothetical protein